MPGRARRAPSPVRIFRTMAHLLVFNSVSLDGYVTDARNDMSWAHQDPNDAEWNAFVAGNASGGGMLVFGRVTYDMMAAWWPTPAAAKAMPEVARGMNERPKLVFSRTMKEAAWQNTRVSADPVGEIRRLRKGTVDMAVLGSASIVAELAGAGLVDTLQVVMVPVVLGAGRTMFEGVKKPLAWKLASSRAFRNGSVVLTYEPR